MGRVCISQTISDRTISWRDITCTSNLLQHHNDNIRKHILHHHLWRSTVNLALTDRSRKQIQTNTTIKSFTIAECPAGFHVSEIKRFNDVKLRLFPARLEGNSLIKSEISLRLDLVENPLRFSLFWRIILFYSKSLIERNFTCIFLLQRKMDSDSFSVAKTRQQIHLYSRSSKDPLRR